MSERKPRRVVLDLRGLSGHEDLWRFSQTSKRDPAVERWLSADPAELRSIARMWFARLRSCGDDVRELLHDGCPVACVRDTPFAYVNTFNSHVNVGFYHGAFLPDPARLLQGSGKRMRHVKVTLSATIDADALSDLIDAAYADAGARLAAAPQ